MSLLPTVAQEQVRALLYKYSSVFSGHEMDLGCTTLVAHDIPLLDDVPVKQRYTVGVFLHLNTR